jgi:hypothetical protein
VLSAVSVPITEEPLMANKSVTWAAASDIWLSAVLLRFLIVSHAWWRPAVRSVWRNGTLLVGWARRSEGPPCFTDLRWETASLSGLAVAFPGVELPRPGLRAGGRDGDNRTGRSCGHAGTNLRSSPSGDLQGFLGAAECRVRKVGPGTLDVTIPRAPSNEQAQREIALYLKAWQAMNPRTHARLVGEGRESGPT